MCDATQVNAPNTQRNIIVRKRKFITTEELRRIFAASPAPDYALMRAEIDAYFGEDRVGDDEWRRS